MKRAMKSHITILEPNPSAFETRKYTEDEKQKLIDYMLSFEVYAAAGRIADCVTGERTKEEDVGYNDSEYMWTSQDIYHIRKYNAAVTDSFLNKATR